MSRSLWCQLCHSLVEEHLVGTLLNLALQVALDLRGCVRGVGDEQGRDVTRSAEFAGSAEAQAREAPGKGTPAQARGRVPGGTCARVLPFHVSQGADLANSGALQVGVEAVKHTQ